MSQISKPQWVDGIGGPGTNSIPSGVRADKQNNVYITGIFNGTVDFDPSPGGVYNLTSIAGSFDTYVAKYTAAGALIWAVSVGGIGTDQVNSITIDDGGNPTVCGQYDSPSMDADPGVGVFTLNNNGDKDAFIIRLTTNGTFSWAHSLGGSQTDYGGKIVADSQGSVVAVSQYQGAINVGGQSFTSQGSFNGLAVKYDVNGNFVWAINIADSNDSETHSCAIDANNDVILSGVFTGNDNFNPLGTATFLNGNSTSTFLAKYTPDGKLIWAKNIQGGVVNNNTNVCVNSKNDIYIDGPFSSQLTFNGVKSLNAQGQQDIFIAKYKSDGTFHVANDIGAPGGSIYNYGIVASKDDEIYISGYFSGRIDFDPSTTNALIQDHGQRDLFLSKFDENVNYKWAFSAGSPNCNNTLGRNVDIDQNNAVLLVGSFCSTVNFDATSCSAYPLTAQSDVRDSFVAKYIQSVAATTIQITGFSVPVQSIPAVIDQTKLKITVTVPQGTNITALLPTITVSSGVALNPASGVAQDFTNPVSYQLKGNNCQLLNYVVEVVFASNAVKTPTICSGATTILAGDIINPVPGSFIWQQFKNGIWVNAPGQIDKKDYTTTSLTNSGTVDVVYSLRRQANTQGVIAADSRYDVTVQSSNGTTNNVITSPAVTTFCSNGDPSVIIGNVPSGGTGAFIYQWQRSADGVNFTDINGATAINFDPPVVASDTYYRRVVSSGTCVSPSLSNVISIKILPAIANNVITSPVIATFCNTGNPALITGSAPTGGTSSFTYQWQTSTNNTTFTDIPGATAKDYDPATISVTSYYRRAVISASCATPVLSNEVTITVQPALSNNQITAPAITIFCASGNPLAIIGNVPSGGDGAFSYSWQSSADDVTFFTIAGANAKDYDPGVVNTTNYYRRLAVSTLCTVPLASNVVTITVQPLISNNAITAPIVNDFCATGSAGAIFGSTPAGGSGTFSYQWQSSINNTTFTDIAGATSKDYDTQVVNTTTYFRRTVVSGACNLPVLSNAVTIKIEPVLAANTITVPAVNTFCVATKPGAITGSIPTGGNSVYAYQWQASTDNINFVNIAGAVAKDYDPPVVGVTTYFRRSITSDLCTVPLLSNAVSIKIVIPVVIINNLITAPGTTTFCTSGVPAVITGNTPSGGIGTFTYQWQSSVNNVTFNNITGATAIDLDPGIISADTYYRRVATSGNCVAAVNSNVVSLKILPAIANNVITAPITATFCVAVNPATIAGSTPTGGSGNYTYQWQSSANNITFTDIAGATAKDYDPLAVSTTTYYRRLVTSAPCNTPLVSNVVTIIIQLVITNNNVVAPAVTSFCINGNSALITGNVPSGGNGTYGYQWQTSADNSSFGNIAGATAKDYDPPVVSADTYYRRLVTSGTCIVPVLSNVVVIKILSTPITPVFVDASPLVCPGSDITLKINSPITGLVYNWYASPAKTNVLFSGISYSTGNLSAAKSYYVEASNGTCGSALATTTVGIASPPTAPVLALNPVAVCSGSATTLNIALPQNGFIYNWYSTANGGTSLHAGTSFPTPVITIATTYYAEATNASGCISITRTPVNITVNPLPQLTIQDMAICPGNSASLTAVVPNFTGQIGWYADATTTTALQLSTSKNYNTPVLNLSKNYYVEAVSASNCKTPVRSKVTVTMLQQLGVPVVTVDSTTNSTIIFKWDAVTGAQGYQVSINGGKTFISPSTGTTGLSHKVTGLQFNQQVTILVQALGASACQLSGSSTAVTGTAISQLGNQIFVANAFTPNGDGNNDMVYVHSESIKSISFYVYDQWGELLFSSTDIKKGWDGYYKGTRQPTGVYVYFVKATMNDGAQLNKKGTITLLR